MASINVLFNRKGSLLKDGKGTIDFAVVVNRTPTYIASKLSVFPEHWDKKKARVNNKFPLYVKFNDFLESKVSEVETYLNKCTVAEITPQIERVKLIIKGEVKAFDDFLAFALHEIGLRTDLTTSTISSHKLQINKLIELFPGGTWSWNDMNYETIQFIDKKLTLQGLSENTKWKVHKVVKTYLNIARIKQLCKDDPYTQFKVKRTESTKGSISAQDIDKLITVLDLNKNDGHTISLSKYIFSCFTGLRISDVEVLKNEHFKIEGSEVYVTFQQQKSKRYIRNFPLLKVAKVLGNVEVIQLIFNKHYSEVEENFFPKQKDQVINRQLKDWMNIANVKTHLTFHTARHTFGTRLAEITGDVLLIKELMGHAKVETSMEYIHLTSKGIERKLDRFI